MKRRKAYMSGKVSSLPPMTWEDKKFKQWIRDTLWKTFDRVIWDDDGITCRKCVANATRYISERVRKENERREGVLREDILYDVYAEED